MWKNVIKLFLILFTVKKKKKKTKKMTIYIHLIINNYRLIYLLVYDNDKILMCLSIGFILYTQLTKNE